MPARVSCSRHETWNSDCVHVYFVFASTTNQVRFVLNLPEAELSSADRLFFQVGGYAVAFQSLLHILVRKKLHRGPKVL